MTVAKTLWVQYAYEATAVLRGMRNARRVMLCDEVPVQVRVADEGDVATALRLWRRRDGRDIEIALSSFKGSLWRPVWANDGAPVAAEAFETLVRGRAPSGDGLRDNPFVPADLRRRARMDRLLTLETLNAREILSDDRERRAAEAARAAGSLVICGDRILRRTVEPLWRATMSGDSVTVEWILGTGETPQSAAHCFRIDRFDDAMMFAEDLARETGLGFAGTADCSVGIVMPETLARNDVVRLAEANLAAAHSGASALLPGLERGGMMAYCDLRDAVQAMKAAESVAEREAAAREGFEALVTLNADLDSADDAFRSISATLRRRLQAPLLRYVGFERSNLTSEELAALDDFQTEGPRP